MSSLIGLRVQGRRGESASGDGAPLGSEGSRLRRGGSASGSPRPGADPTMCRAHPGGCALSEAGLPTSAQGASGAAFTSRFLPTSRHLPRVQGALSTLLSPSGPGLLLLSHVSSAARRRCARCRPVRPKQGCPWPEDPTARRKSGNAGPCAHDSARELRASERERCRFPGSPRASSLPCPEHSDQTLQPVVGLLQK